MGRFLSYAHAVTTKRLVVCSILGVVRKGRALNGGRGKGRDREDVSATEGKRIHGEMWSVHATHMDGVGRQTR